MPRARMSPRLLVVVGVVGIIACWLLATPRYAGPDEPSHTVAAAALVRGHVTGRPVQVGYPEEAFDLPAMVATPNPACFALQPDVAASCAGEPDDSTASAERGTTSANYPIWGHLLPGLASFVPSPAAFLYLARALNAVLAVLLLVAAFRRTRIATPWMSLALAVGCTPIVWFTMSVVSPSAVAIAGGAALWVALLVPRPEPGDWLLVGGWLGVLLPRRDGPLWATLAIAIACVAIARPPTAVLARLTTWQRRLVLVSLPLPLLPSLMNGFEKFNTALALAPLLLLATSWAVGRTSRRVRQRAGVVHPLVWVATAIAAVGVLLLGVNVLRPGGADLPLTLQIIAKTGRHLRQMVGALGWLDTPVPDVVVVIFWLLLGTLAGLVLLRTPRLVALAASVLASAVVLAWLLELGTGDTSTGYWQGRYSMPLVIGAPLLLASGLSSAPRRRDVTTALSAVVWVGWNASFYWALHRWAVGVSGVVSPWRWDDAGGLLPPLVFLVLHAAASGALLFGLRDGADILDGS